MTGPDFVLCLSCETPCYDFEWEDGRVSEALCQVCGNDEADQFLSEDDLEALANDPRS